MIPCATMTRAGVAIARRRFSWSRAVLRTMVPVLAFLLLAGFRPQALAEAEREFPESYSAAGEQRYRHPAFGFSLPAPPGRFQEAPALADPMRAGLSGIGGWAWAWEDEATGDRLTMMLIKVPGSERKDFEDYCRGFRDSLVKQGFAVVRDEGRWEDGRGDYLLDTLIDERIHSDHHCISGRADGDTSYIVCVAAITAEPTWSRRFLAGLEPAG